MKILRSKRGLALFLAALIALCPCLAGLSEGEAPVTATFRFDKTSYKVNTEVKVDYALSGGSGNYTNVYISCIGRDGATMIYYLQKDNCPASGTITFTPKVGQFFNVFIEGRDTGLDDDFSIKSEDIPLTGSPVVPPLTVSVKFTQSTYKAGTPVTVSYSVTGGSGSYPFLRYEYHDEHWGNDGYADLQAAKGKFSFTPTGGNLCFVGVYGEDSDRREFYMGATAFLSDGTPIEIGNTDIKRIKDQAYTGKKLTPKPAISFIYDDLRLIEGQDYTLSFANNKDIGTATVTITGKGFYTGTATVTFSIVPKAVKLSSLKAGKKKLSVKWAKGTGITGYEIEYSLSKSFSNSKKITVSRAATVKKDITKLTKGKKYYVRVRAFKKVGGKKYYSAWSGVKNATVK